MSAEDVAPARQWMPAFWVIFSDRAPGTVEGADMPAAVEAARAFGKPVGASRLPYPRSPQLGRTSESSLCSGRDECLNKTACPQRYACSE